MLAFVVVVGAGDAGWRRGARPRELDLVAGIRDCAAGGPGNLELARSDELRPVRELAEATEARVLAFAVVVGTGDAGWRRGARPRELDRMAGIRDCATGEPGLRELARCRDALCPAPEIADTTEVRPLTFAVVVGTGDAGWRRGARPRELDRMAGIRDCATGEPGLRELARCRDALCPAPEIADTTEVRPLTFAVVVGTGDAGWRRGARPRELDLVAGIQDCAAGGPDLRERARRREEPCPAPEIGDAAAAPALVAAAAAGSEGAGERRGAGASA